MGRSKQQKQDDDDMKHSEDNVRHLNPKRSKQMAKQNEIPWKTIAFTAAIASIAGYVGVELIKLAVRKTKEAVPDDKGQKAAQQNPTQPPQLPGSVSPGMFQSPYSQMAAVQGFPAPFQNPMVVPSDDDEPPKWFLKFKEVSDKRMAELEKFTQAQIEANAQAQRQLQAARLSTGPMLVEEDDDEDYDEDYDEDVA